jgi:hypothetical protein
VANLVFRLFISIFKFPVLRFTIAIVWNNSIAFYVFITRTTTSSTDFGVLVYVIGYLNPFTNVPISYTNLLRNSNSNANPFIDPSILTSIYIFNGPIIAKEGYVSTLFVYSLVYWPSFICCCCKCYYKCCGLPMVSIQSSYTSPSKCKCSSPFGNLMSFPS